MCFDFDARPPAPPEDLLLAPIAGGAGAEVLELTSADGTHFSAAIAEASADRGAGVLIFPDVRGLYPFYSELAERFAQAGYHAIAMDYFGRTAGLGPRDEEFEYMPHVQQLTVPGVQQDGGRRDRRLARAGRARARSPPSASASADSSRSSRAPTWPTSRP